MKRFLFMWLLASWTTAAAVADAGGKAKHIVVVVWDGLRPDSVTEKQTPTLYKLAKDGVFFQNHHSVYASSTEVNAVAMATGAYPARSGILANREYRPALDPLKRVGIESAETMRKGDAVSGGHFLQLPTIAEMFRRAGRKVAIAGGKPAALLFDRSDREHVILTDSKKLESPNTRSDATVTRALLGKWDTGVPAFSLLWLSEPDVTQHATAPGTAKSLEALAGSDHNLALVLDELKAKGARQDTDVFVVSDHGFSTIARTVDVADALRQAGFKAVREFKEPPVAGDVMVVGNGGSVLIYITGHERKLTRQIVEFLQQQEFPGVIFTRDPVRGTFTLDQVRINTADAPDIVVALRWSDDKNASGVAGSVISDASATGHMVYGVGQGNHASLSRYDMRATLIAAGPDFRRGMVDELPSSNADLAPTILWLLGTTISEPMDGRILLEATPVPVKAFPALETRAIQTSSDFTNMVWHQYLRITDFAGATYFDEGNGAPTPK